MLKRILDRKPEMSRQSWSDSWSRNLSYLDNISKYGNEWHEGKVMKFLPMSFDVSRSIFIQPSSRGAFSRQASSRRSKSAPREMNDKLDKDALTPHATDFDKTNNDA